MPSSLHVKERLSDEWNALQANSANVNTTCSNKKNIQRRTYLGRVMSVSSTSEGHVGWLKTTLQMCSCGTLTCRARLAFCTQCPATASCHYPEVIAASAIKTQHAHTVRRAICQNYPTCTYVLLSVSWNRSWISKLTLWYQGLVR